MKVTSDGCLFGAWIANHIRKEQNDITNALDIGAGTGLLSLMVAQKKGLAIDAIEIEENAFEQLKENIDASPWRENIQPLHNDVTSYIFHTPYDIIYSNPPFYENDLKSNDPRKNIALHGNGLVFSDLLKVIKCNLSPDGIFFILLPYKRMDDILPALNEHELDLSHITLVRQSVRHDYFRIMLKGKAKTNKYSEFYYDEISIWDEKRQYTDKFKNLLREYYLYL